MSADYDLLETTLADLERQLAQTPLENTTRDRLESLVAEIRLTLDSSDEETVTSEEEKSLGERLYEATQDFEGSHPQLTGTVSSIVEALARMGI